MTQRFTLSHSVLGSQVISEPSGWADCTLKLERHPDYHSLVEYFDGSFIFYGSDGVSIDGGFNFIRQVEDIYGPDAKIDILIEISFDGDTYQTVFSGQLDLSLSEELINNKIRVPIIRDDFWAKFISRNDTPVNLISTTGVDGDPVTVYPYINLVTRSQKVRQTFEGHNSLDTSISFDIPDNQYGQIDFEREILSEIEAKYNYPIAENSELPFELFQIEYSGTYAIEAKIYLSVGVILSTAVSHQIVVAIQINDNSPINFTITDETSGLDSWTKYEYSASHELSKGDLIRIFIFNDNAPGVSYQFVWRAGVLNDSYLKIIADTVYDRTNTKGFLIHDAAAQIIERIVGEPGFYSDYFGGLLTQTREYEENGCGWRFGIFKGLQVRQYTLTERPFFMSFKDWWQGANPIFNLGLGYEDTETSPEQQVIRVEEKSHFYNETVSINFSNVRQISRVYDNEYIFNKIEIGYSKWNSDSASGNDDPQTKRVFSTVFSKIGRSIQLFSSFIAASLTFEITRRTSREKSADYRYDDDVFIVSLNQTQTVSSPELSPDIMDFNPEFNENFVVSDDLEGNPTLLNKAYRYNIRLSPMRNLKRWFYFFTGALQKNLTSFVRFQSGEGNYKMATFNPGILESACPGSTGSATENQNIDLAGLDDPLFGVDGSDYLFIPKLFNITMPMELEEYQTIVANRKKAIGISQTQDNHTAFFIKTLEYQPWHGKAVITAWPKTEFTIQSDQTCGIPPPEEGFILMETGDYVLQEEGSKIEVQ